MSLRFNEVPHTGRCQPEEAPAARQREIDRLDHYLSIIENNRKASLFVPNDVLLALDMAGFAVSILGNGAKPPRISTARLALALAQPCQQAPVQ